MKCRTKTILHAPLPDSSPQRHSKNLPSVLFGLSRQVQNECPRTGILERIYLYLLCTATGSSDVPCATGEGLDLSALLVEPPDVLVIVDAVGLGLLCEEDDSDGSSSEAISASLDTFGHISERTDKCALVGVERLDM